MADNLEDSEIIEAMAAAIYEARPTKPVWASLMSWANGSASSTVEGSVGWQSAQVRGEKPFEEARVEAERVRDQARAALDALRKLGVLASGH